MSVCPTSHSIKQHFFAERLVAPWNYLPVDIVDFSTLKRFKKSIELVDFRKFLNSDVRRLVVLAYQY